MRPNEIVIQILAPLTLWGLSGCKTHAIIDPLPPPPAREALVGTWVYASAFRAYRLDLLENGAAELATGHRLEQGLRRYRCDSWQLDGYELFATFNPINPTHEVVYLRATATSDQALLKVSVGLSPSGRVPIADEFTLASTVLQWLDALTVTNTDE